MFEWISANWENILLVIGGVITLASVIAKITPNETDNKVLEVIIKIFEKLSLNTKSVNSDKK
jgi:hypothetical protein